MLQQLAQQLRNTDPAQRKQAIQALIEIDDPRISQALQRMAANDPDPTVRAAAEDAEREIQLRQWRRAESDNAAAMQIQMGLAPAGDSAGVTAGAGIDPLTDVSASDAARSALKAAFDQKKRGAKSAAQNSLARAVDAYPPYRRNDQVRQLARDLTGKVPEDAFAALSMRLEAQPVTDQTNSGCLVLILEMIVLFLVGAAGVMLIFTLFRQSPELTQALAQATPSGQRAFNQIFSASQTTLLGVSGVVGVLIVVGMVIYSLVVHYFSVWVLGGQGNFIEALNALLGIAVVSWIISFALTGATYYPPFARQAGIASLISLLQLVSSLGILAAEVYYVSKVERFGYGRGIVAVIVAPIAFVIVACLCIFALSFLSAASSFSPR